MLRKAIYILFIMLLATAGWAGVIDFESGSDGQSVQSTIQGMEFSTTGGKDWIYGDWRTGKYNGVHPDGSYFSNGNFFAWLGPDQDIGEITLTEARATYFTIGYSAQYLIEMEAYDSSMSLVDSQSGMPNLEAGQLDFLTLTGDAIAFVRIKEASGWGNYWVIDDIDTDAVIHCSLDIHCDDGDFCNGQEICVDYLCQPAEELPCLDDNTYCNGEEYCDQDAQECAHENIPCEDDELFCNGTESCDEQLDKCENSGDPCPSGQKCDEELDECVSDETDPEEESPTPNPGSDEDAVWPKGEVSGGCCGC